MEEEEALSYLHETIQSLEPRPHNDRYEIGYPAKFSSRLLDREGWTVREVRRYGVFARNQLISDEEIIKEISGYEGTTGQRFKRLISVNNPAHMASAKTAIHKCLEFNPVWRRHILRQLDEIASEYPSSQVEIHIFNPSTGVLTLFFAGHLDDGVLYVPNYGMTVIDEKSVARRAYYGCLIETGKGLTFQQIIKKHYGGNLFSLLLSFTWGGYETRDTEILSDLGLSYQSFRCDIDGNSRTYAAWRDDRWQPTEFINPLTTVFEYLSKSPDLVGDLAGEIGSRWKGGIVQDDSVGENKLNEIADLKEGQGRGFYWRGEIKRCDTCGHDFENDKFMVDGAIESGHWACMCSRCYLEHSAQIGWGKGQLYMQNQEGWLQVGGFGPVELGDDI
jgi:hypothetical protein